MEEAHNLPSSTSFAHEADIKLVVHSLFSHYMLFQIFPLKNSWLENDISFENGPFSRDIRQSSGK